MFKYLIKGLLAGITVKLVDSWRRISTQLLKIEAAKLYLHGVQMARWSAISLMRMGLAIGLIGVGMLLFHAGLFILLPWTAESKAIVGIFLGLVYGAFGFVMLRATINEKTWMEKARVAELLEEAGGQSKKTDPTK